MKTNKPIITTKQARRLLGKESEKLNDVEVMEIVICLQGLAKDYLSKKSVKKSNKRLKLDNGISKPKNKS